MARRRQVTWAQLGSPKTEGEYSFGFGVVNVQQRDIEQAKAEGPNAPVILVDSTSADSTTRYWLIQTIGVRTLN